MESELPIEQDAASEVMEKIAQFRMKRQQAKTQDELTAIKARIENTLQDYDDIQFLSSNQARVEFLDDLSEFQKILGDNILKNEYQQKLTVFIVGYKNLCSQRLEILSQLSDFFGIYNIDEDMEEAISDSNLEDLHESMQGTLDTMGSALHQLDGVGHDMLSFMGHLHAITSSKTTKTKKKLEKSLQNAKEEILKLTEKIRIFQQDLGFRDSKIEKINMHLDAKKMEIANLKNQIEISKKTHAAELETARQERNSLQLTVEGLEQRVSSTQITTLANEMTPSQDGPPVPARRIESKLQEIRDTALNELTRLKEKMTAEKLDVPEIKRELAEQFQVQLEQMRTIHAEELDEWRQDCTSHIFNILEIEVGEEESQKWMNPSQPPSSEQIKEKPPSPYQTSSVYSDTKPPTVEEMGEEKKEEEEDNNVATENLSNLSVGEITSHFEEYRKSSSRELSRLKRKVRSMEGVQESMRGETIKWQEERERLLSRIEELKFLQEAAEADAEEAMRSLEEFAAEQERSARQDGNDDDNANVTNELTEDNVQKIDDVTGTARTMSPSTFSKPASPMTSRSLVSAYRQKIAERREAINKKRAEGVGSRTGGPDTPQLKGLFDSGLMEEFLRSYRAVVQFKDKISQEISHYPTHQIKAHAINSLKTDDFDATNDQVQLYVSRMSGTVEQVLSCVGDNVAAALADDVSGGNDHLRIQVGALQEELLNLRAEYEKRTQHDAAMIMHMQNTLSETQRGNTTAAGTSGSGFPSSPAAPIYGKTPSTSQRPRTNESEVTIVFTRQDNEHNAAELKRSAAMGKITQGTLESVVTTMEAYNDIPARRIQHLANKLLHHRKMKIIETNVRNSNLVTSEVFNILEKMEELQQRRAQTWSRQMDEMTSERRRLAVVLCDALQRLESITGAFLIKPVVSFKGKGQFRKYSGKISTRFNKYQVEAMLQKMLIRKSQMGRTVTAHDAAKVSSVPPISFTRIDANALKPSPLVSSQPLTVAGLRGGEAPPMWNVGASLSQSLPVSRIHRSDKRATAPQVVHPTSVPKLLELDLSRYQLELSNVHSTISPDASIGNDRLKNMEALRLRSQTNMRVTSSGLQSSSQPIVIPKSQESPSLDPSPDYKSSAPPTTPASLSQVLGRNGSSELRMLSGADDAAVFTPGSPKPLPPIRMTSMRSSVTSGGSSKRLTPLSPSRSMPDMNDVINGSQKSSPMLSARKDMATSPALV